MVIVGSTACCGVVVLEHHYGRNIPKYLYLIVGRGGDRRVDYVSVQKALIALLLNHGMDEIVACRISA